MAQKLDPELQKVYERVMNTPTANKTGATPTGAHATSKIPPPPPPPQKNSTPFLSSMPMQPVKNLGVKAFTFTGKKKVVQKQEVKLPETPAPTTTSGTLSQKTPVNTKPKNPASKKLIIIVGIGVVIAWGIFWAFILGFIG